MFGIDDAIAAGLKVLDKFVPDPGAKAQAEAELRNSLQAWDKAQTDVNAVEAGSGSIFVAGWRPFIGWVCGGALAYNYIARPLLQWGVNIYDPSIPLPPAFDGMLMELVLGMLGMGGLRTFEKIKGVAR